MAGSAVIAPATLSATATPAPKLADTRILPGATSMAAVIAAASAAPAKTIVRPAVSTAVSAAARSSNPAASSSRKRDTSRSA